MIITSLIISSFIFFVFAVYERGKRIGVEQQIEQIYDPIISKLFDTFDQKAVLREIRDLAVKSLLGKPVPQDWRKIIAKVDTVLGIEDDKIK